MDEQESDTPSLALPSRQDLFLGGIFLILFLTALHLAADFFVPLTAAILFAFVLQPLQRFFLKLHVPPFASAFLIILLLLGGFWSLGSALTGPAATWAAQVPDSLPELRQKFHFLSQPVEKTKRIVSQAEDMANAPGTKVTPVAVQGSRLFDRLVSGARAAVGGILTMLLLLFFLLAAGDIFTRRVIDIMPGAHSRRQIIDIFHRIEGDISRYLMTITVMNMLVGASAAAIMWSYNIEDPMLWGIFAFVLNFVPIMGPLMVFLSFLVLGFMELGYWHAVMPAVLFLCAHVTESAFVTPRLLARQFTINPLIVILGLVFWYWMWGFAGALLSVPMIMIAKIVFSRVDRLRPLAHALEG